MEIFEALREMCNSTAIKFVYDFKVKSLFYVILSNRLYNNIVDTSFHLYFSNIPIVAVPKFILKNVFVCV